MNHFPYYAIKATNPPAKAASPSRAPTSLLSLFPTPALALFVALVLELVLLIAALVVAALALMLVVSPAVLVVLPLVILGAELDDISAADDGAIVVSIPPCISAGAEARIALCAAFA